MAAQVPTSPPVQFSAGDSVRWKVTFPDYPAGSGYAIRYTMHSGTDKVTFDSTADGNDHLVSLTSDVTMSYAAGQYTFKAHAVKTGERWAVDEGIITILPDFTASDTVDPRTETKRQLDDVNDAINGLVSGRLTSYSTVSGTFTLINLESLRTYRNELQARVNRENGTGGAVKIRHRFTSPR